jgi:hypothetical protein
MLSIQAHMKSQAEVRPEDRRRTPRLPISRSVKVYVPAVGRYFGGVTRDVARTGYRVELPARAGLGVNSQLDIHVSPDDGADLLANRHMLRPARVVWVGPCADDGMVTAGVELVLAEAAVAA